MKLAVKRHLGVLKAHDGASQDMLDSLKFDKVYEINIKPEGRSGKQLRLYWALIGLCLDNQDYFTDKDELSDCIQEVLNSTVQRKRPDGTTFTALKSLSFSGMTPNVFKDYLDRVLDFIVIKIIPGTDREEFENTFYEMIGERGPLSC